MLDQSKFMEMLQEITEVARVQENSITKEEVQQFFSGLEVTEQHLQHVYQYLAENGIKIPGFVMSRIGSEPTEEKTEENKEEKDETEQSVSYRLYMEELDDLELMLEEEKTRLFLDLRNGNQDAKTRLLEGYLPIVVKLAENYKDKGMPVEDLIQEGNIGLFQALEQVHDINKIEEADTFVIETVRRVMVEAVDEEIGESDMETTVVAKTGLINEAAKYLAEELGRVATVAELAEYTKLAESEIADVLKLSLDAVKIGKGDIA